MTDRRAPASLKARAIAWLSMREHSRGELERKLRALVQRREREASAAVAAAASRLDGDASMDGSDSLTGVGVAFAVGDAGVARVRGSIDVAAPHPRDPEDIPALLDWLEARGYLSDRRYAETRVRSRAERYGLQRIRQELSSQGVALDDDLRATLQASEQERARALCVRKFGESAPADAADRARRMRVLMARGFSADAARRAVPRAAGAAGRADAEADDGDDLGDEEA